MNKLLLVILLIPVTILAQTNVFILCEGNMTQLNSSLWILNEDLNQITGPIHWDSIANPLGDVGQSMTIYNNKLYIIMNNSHTIEVVDLSDSIHYEMTISVLGASPREMEVVEGIGYLTCWNLHGILVIDLDSGTLLDTLVLSDVGQPEDIVFSDGKLYTSIKQNSDWSAGHQIFEISINTEPTITDTFEVIDGPGQMLIHDGFLYVVSTYFDASYNSYIGMSRIDLLTGEVTKKDYGQTYIYDSDITFYNDKIYFTYSTGIVPLSDSLTIEESGLIGNLSGIYSMASYNGYIYFGLSDYIAPDDIIVLDSLGNQIGSFTVGACPGSFAFYSSQQNSIKDNSSNIQTASLYSLHQNFPNPFNSYTTIPYYIGGKSHITISIYDLLGHHIVDLVNTNQNKGNKSISWNGKDKFGKTVPGGIYIYELKTGGVFLAKKLVYIK